jgi:hypothetical protein
MTLRRFRHRTLEILQLTPESRPVFSQEILGQLQLCLQGAPLIFQQPDLLVQDFNFLQVKSIKPIPLALKRVTLATQVQGPDELNTSYKQQGYDRAPLSKSQIHHEIRYPSFQELGLRQPSSQPGPQNEAQHQQ